MNTTVRALPELLDARERSPEATVMSATSNVLNPDFSIRTEYRPGGNKLKMNSPVSLVSAVRLLLVPRFTRVTFAEGTTDPEASTTRPTMSAVVTWACATANNRRTAEAASTILCVKPFRPIEFPL